LGIEGENPLGITRVIVNFRLKISSALANKTKRDTRLNFVEVTATPCSCAVEEVQTERNNMHWKYRLRNGLH